MSMVQVTKVAFDQVDGIYLSYYGTQLEFSTTDKTGNDVQVAIDVNDNVLRKLAKYLNEHFAKADADNS